MLRISFFSIFFLFLLGFARGLCNLHDLRLNGRGTLLHVRCMTVKCVKSHTGARPRKAVSLTARRRLCPWCSSGVQGWAVRQKPGSSEGVGAARERSSGVKLQGFNQQTRKSPLASPPVSVSVRGAVQNLGVDF